MLGMFIRQLYLCWQVLFDMLFCCRHDSELTLIVA